jgi:hypothetical protein
MSDYVPPSARAIEMADFLTSHPDIYGSELLQYLDLHLMRVANDTREECAVIAENMENPYPKETDTRSDSFMEPDVAAHAARDIAAAIRKGK